MKPRVKTGSYFQLLAFHKGSPQQEALHVYFGRVLQQMTFLTQHPKGICVISSS